jgi:Flp pilus assembly pilin Flp
MPDSSSAPAFARSLCARQEGAALVEYGLLLGVIAAGCLLALSHLGATLANAYAATAKTIQAATSEEDAGGGKGGGQGKGGDNGKGNGGGKGGK